MSKPTPIREDGWDRPPLRNSPRGAEEWLTLGHKFASYLVCAFVIGGSIPAWNLLNEIQKTIVEVKLVTSAAAAAQAVRDQAQNDAMEAMRQASRDRMTDSERRLTFLESRIFGRTLP